MEKGKTTEIKVAFLNNRVKSKFCVVKLVAIGEKIILKTWDDDDSEHILDEFEFGEIDSAIEGFNENVEEIMGSGMMLMVVE